MLHYNGHFLLFSISKSLICKSEPVRIRKKENYENLPWQADKKYVWKRKASRKFPPRKKNMMKKIEKKLSVHTLIWKVLKFLTSSNSQYIIKLESFVLNFKRTNAFLFELINFVYITWIIYFFKNKLFSPTIFHRYVTLNISITRWAPPRKRHFPKNHKHDRTPTDHRTPQTSRTPKIAHIPHWRKHFRGFPLRIEPRINQSTPRPRRATVKGILCCCRRKGIIQFLAEQGSRIRRSWTSREDITIKYLSSAAPNSTPRRERSIVARDRFAFQWRRTKDCQLTEKYIYLLYKQPG